MNALSMVHGFVENDKIGSNVHYMYEENEWLNKGKCYGQARIKGLSIFRVKHVFQSKLHLLYIVYYVFVNAISM